MDCREVQERLEDYVLDDLPHVDRLRVELHLRHCVPCSHDREDSRRFLKTCREAMIRRDVRDDFDTLLDRIAKSEARMRAESANTGRKLRLLWRRSAAAVLVVAAGLTLLHMANPLDWFDESRAAGAARSDMPIMVEPFVSHRAELNKEFVQAGKAENGAPEKESPGPKTGD